jgi:hypothetical protein
MSRLQASERVPKQMQPIFDAIVALTNQICAEHLNDEYAQLARKATAALSRKRPSPLLKGTAVAWACGIIHALGYVNFLFDQSQTPHMSAGELYKSFGVSAGTGSAKSKTVRDALDMSALDPNWCLPSNLDDNPLVWMVMVNGMIVDARTLPHEVQMIASEKGLIPYIPGENKEE